MGPEIFMLCWGGLFNLEYRSFLYPWASFHLSVSQICVARQKQQNHKWWPRETIFFKMSVPARKQLSISSRGKVIISLLSSSIPIALHMLFRFTDDIYHLRLEFTRQIFEAVWVSPFPFSHALVWVEPRERKAPGVSFSLPCGSIVFCSLSLHSFWVRENSALSATEFGDAGKKCRLHSSMYLWLGSSFSIEKDEISFTWLQAWHWPVGDWTV